VVPTRWAGEEEIEWSLQTCWDESGNSCGCSRERSGWDLEVGLRREGITPLERREPKKKEKAMPSTEKVIIWRQEHKAEQIRESKEVTSISRMGKRGSGSVRNLSGAGSKSGGGVSGAQPTGGGKEKR